jgi:hypothetical protein
MSNVSQLLLAKQCGNEGMKYIVKMILSGDREAKERSTALQEVNASKRSFKSERRAGRLGLQSKIRNLYLPVGQTQ